MSKKDEALKLALEALEVATTPLAKDRQEVLRARAAIREALAEPPAKQQDLPDFIAGALGVSRGTAYDMMRDALADQDDPDLQDKDPELVEKQDMPKIGCVNHDCDKCKAQQPVANNKFTRAWLRLDELPGTMMQGPEGLFGPIPGSTSTWVTTSERERDHQISNGNPMLEVYTSPPASKPRPLTGLLSIARRHPDGQVVTVSFKTLDAAIAFERYALDVAYSTKEQP